MPQVDLETLVSACAGGSCDNKIACETLAADAEKDNNTTNSNNNNNNNNPEAEQPDIPPDFPPESFWLSKDAEFDWFDRNAFYERKESQKGNSNSANLNPNTSSTSQRFSSTLKSKASIIGLPKPQKNIVGTKTKRNCRPGNTRWFPKRSGSTLKSDAAVVEPSSPKVSCMGRVRSKKDRCRLKNHQRSASESEPAKSKSERKGKLGFFSGFRAIFLSGLRKRTESEKWETLKDSSSTSKQSSTVINHDIRDRLPPGEFDAPPKRGVATSEPRNSLDGEQVGLGGMKRFTSGRRSDAFGADVA